MNSNSKLFIFKKDLFTKPRAETVREILNSPLKKKDVEFMLDIIDGLSYRALSEKYKITIDGVYKKKRRCINDLYFYRFYLNKN